MSMKYSEDFKKTVVHAYETSSKSPALIATEYGITRSTVLQWVKLYSKECPHLKKHTTTTRARTKELTLLHRRIQELEKENDFLKKASAFFAIAID